MIVYIYLWLHYCWTDERNRRERFAVAQQIAEDDRSLEERKKRIENEKEEFLKQSDGGDHSCTLAEGGNIEFCYTNGSMETNNFIFSISLFFHFYC